MAKISTIAVLVLALLIAAPTAWADIYDENSDDAQPGQAIPLVCRDHPAATASDPARRAAQGSRLCEGFILSKVPVRGQPASEFDAALDVAVAIPQGTGPFPILVQVHGYGGSKGGSGDDYRILKEGIALIRYSTRGFGESYGDNQLADEDFEIRDAQNIVRAVVEGSAFATPPAAFDRKKIAIIGASYGGGHSLLLAQTKMRTWPCVPDTCELVTAVPIVPWTDLAYSLLPNGRPDSRIGDKDYVVGVEKFSYVAGLFASGYQNDARYNGSSYPPFLFEYFTRINAGEPYQDPLTHGYVPPGSGTMEQALRTFSQDRSPAYQDYCAQRPIPLFILQGWTDDLFTVHEVLRLRDVLDTQCGREYPLKLYLGNAGHPRARADDAAEIEFMYGVIGEWLRFYLLGAGAQPALNVISGVTPEPGKPFDPSKVFTVDEVEQMMRGEIKAELQGPARITYTPAPVTTNDLLADPITSFAMGESLTAFGANGEPLFKTVGPLAGDAALYSIDASSVIPAGSTYRTVCGGGRLEMRGVVSATDVTYAVRVWDVGKDNRRYLVDRGVYRHLGSAGAFKIDIPLHGNVWRIQSGHTLQVELTNTDFPYLRGNNFPSVSTIDRADLSLPTCEPGAMEVQAKRKTEVLGASLAATGPPYTRHLGLTLLAAAALLACLRLMLASPKSLA